MPDDATSALRAALDAANQRIASANQRADTAERQVAAERGGRVAAQALAVDSAIAKAEAEATAAQNRWAELQAEGDFVEAAKMMRQMQEATSLADRHRAQKEWIEGQARTAAEAPADPLRNFSPQQRAWIEKNPSYVSDPAYKRRVDAAAMQATALMGIVEDTPEFFEHIEKTINPERQPGSARAQDDPSPLSDTGDDDQRGADDLPVVALQQRHTMPADPVSVSPEAPVMRIDARPEEPQARAVGRGGDGMRSVAAPPSRSIARFAQRTAPANGRIEPTREELETAQALAEAIEPEVLQRGPEETVRWYHALYNTPSAQRKLTRWYGRAA